MLLKLPMNQIDKIKLVEEAKDRIEKALERDGQYSHNMITVALESISKKLGDHVANELIDEYELEELGWRKIKQLGSIPNQI
jgi:uncharacterized protein involved in exopolysaccharide biosynthesis